MEDLNINQASPDQNNPDLVDGKYSIKDLVSLDVLKQVFEQFNQATGYTVGFVSYPEQEILISIGWRDACTKFHRAFPASAEACVKSNKSMTERLKEIKDINLERCEHGLVDGGVPIVIKGKHVATLATGQVFFDKPDLDWFRQQAKKFGFKEDEYVDAIKSVPVVSESDFMKMLLFLKDIAFVIGEFGIFNLRMKEKRVVLEKEISARVKIEKELQVNKDKLKKVIREKTEAVAAAEAQCKVKMEALNELIENIPDAVVVTNLDGVIIKVNKTFVDIFGKEGCAIGKHSVDFVSEGDRHKVINNIKACIEKGHGNNIEVTALTKDKQVIPVLVNSSLVLDDKGNPKSTIALIRNISELKRAEMALSMLESNYRTIFEMASDAMVIRDINNYKVVDANAKACEMFGYAKGEMIGLDLDNIIIGNPIYTNKDIGKFFDKAVDGEPQLFEMLAKDRSGKTFWIENHIKRVIIGGTYRIMAIARDISGRKKSEEKIFGLNKALMEANRSLTKLALRDSHTGLYNHRYFVEAIDSELNRAKRHFSQVSLVMVDIDYFKSINDVYGHQFGDLVLKQFSDMLRKAMRLYDLVARYGGEEFMVIAPGTDRKGALVLGKRILNTVNSSTFGNEKHSVKLKISIAVVSYPQDVMIITSKDFVNIADKVLSKAKEDGGSRVYSYLDLRMSQATKHKGDHSVQILEKKLEKLTARGNQSVVEAIFAFAKTIELKDHYTGKHVENTISFAAKIAEYIGLPREEIEVIKEAAVLHDLGKVGIPEKLLQKTSQLTKEELSEIKKHPQIGADIIRPIHSLRDIVPIILHHHEWWDGSGYPTGLKGEAIPRGARIVAVADVYQALTSNRPYRKAYTKKKALEIIKHGSGTQFDPKIVRAFLKILKF